MEEYDDLAVGPNKDGSLNLSHNTWKTLPPELSAFSGLLHLHMSNNQLTSIPEPIGALVLLRTLDVSINRIEKIDGAIGKCIRLRHFNFAKNRVENLPVDIGNCILMVSICPQRPIRASSLCVIRHDNTVSNHLECYLIRLRRRKK
jgi:Leucine-rich repeat (LRR) protein